MNVSTSEILNLSSVDFYKMTKAIPNFQNLFLAQYVNDLREKINARMMVAWPSLDLSSIQSFFPTLKEFDDSIKDPMYVSCFTSPNNYVVGYTGLKKDAYDKGFSSFPSLGVNLWILIYDPISNRRAFMFIKVENVYEIGTKHGMLLYLVSQTFPSMKIISAGEVLVTEVTNELSGTYYHLIWNATSGTITKKIFENTKVQLSFLSLLYPEINFSALDLKFRPMETILNSISMAELGGQLSNVPTRVYIQIYENVVIGMLQNFLSKII